MPYRELGGKVGVSAHKPRNNKKHDVLAFKPLWLQCELLHCLASCHQFYPTKTQTAHFHPSIQYPQLELILNLAKALSSLPLPVLFSWHSVLSDLKFPFLLLTKPPTFSAARTHVLSVCLGLSCGSNKAGSSCVRASMFPCLCILCACTHMCMCICVPK